MTDLLAAPERTAAVRPRLARLDPDQAHARNRALALAAALQVPGEDRPLAVHVGVDGEAPPSGVLVFAAEAGWLAVAADIVDGAHAPELDPAGDLAPALAELGRLEPVLLAWESASGSSLDPIGVEPAPRPGGVPLLIAFSDSGGRTVHRLRVHVSAGLALSWPGAPGGSGDLGPAAAARVACRLILDGPSLDLAELRGLEGGDLLLLPRAGADGWAARLQPPSAGQFVAGRYDPARGAFQTIAIEDSMLDETAQAAPAIVEPPAEPTPEPALAETPTLNVDALPLALRVVIDEAPLAVGELARLQPGAVLILPDLGDSPRVTVLAENRPVASGRLVAVGEAYGVLIDKLKS